MTPSHESDISSSSFESALTFDTPEAQVQAMASLALTAAEWTQQHGPATYDVTDEQGHKVEVNTGLRLADFETFVGRQSSDMSESDRTVQAARLQNDIARWLHEWPMPEDLSHLDQTSPTAIFRPTDVMRYGVHMMKATGLPFEGTEAERVVAEDIDAHFAALGYDLQDPQVAMHRQEILQTA
jgi:hypothetical protein